MNVWLRFVLAALATWRVTHLLASEDGPADILFRLRVRLGRGFWGKLADCFQCLSLWVALPMALLVSLSPLEFWLAWPALSGAACLLERLGQQPVVIQSLPPDTAGGKENGMLRSETDDHRQPAGAGPNERSPSSG